MKRLLAWVPVCLVFAALAVGCEKKAEVKETSTVETPGGETTTTETTTVETSGENPPAPANP
jgi:hypothetical protein